MNNDINRLYKIKSEILALVKEAEGILAKEFPKYYSVSISFWIPQIITALHYDPKWLPRGDNSMQDVLTKIENDD
jgi:hypothetical protein